MQRFIGKRPHRKIVRPTSNSAIPHKVTDNMVIKKDVPVEEVKNNEEKKEEIIMNDKINKIDEVLNTDKLPKRKVKVEKKDKGLFERTENSAILITEDNKMLLND